MNNPNLPAISVLAPNPSLEVMVNIPDMIKSKNTESDIIINDTIEPHIETDHKEKAEYKSQANEQAIETNITTYSKWTKCIVYLFLLSDIYTRSWPTVFFFYLLKQCVYIFDINGFMVIIASLIVVYAILTIIYEYWMLRWIKLNEHKSTYENELLIRIQETFISFFSSIVNILFLFSLRKFKQKNSFPRYANP